MATRQVATLTAALLVIGAAGQAFALDKWRDRRGLLFGVGIGAGSGQSDIEDDKSHIGFNFSARLGGGVTETLTLDADVSLHRAGYEDGDVDRTNGIFNGMIGANYFVFEGLYARLMGGVAHINMEADPGEDHSQTGLGLGVGAGYEFFATAHLAVGVGGDFRYLSFEDVAFTTINFGVTGTWY